MNEGIIVKNGSIGVAQVVSGKNNTATLNQNDKVIVKENTDNAEDLGAINRKLEDLNSKLSEHKNSLDELGKKISILEAELKEENPSKEKIKRYLKELSLIAFQTTGTTKNMLDLLSVFK
jgi:peptidoglycan hydrolase CwlO-like protein